MNDGMSKALTRPFSDYAAEAEFALDDDEIRRNYDYETGHHRYAGTAVDVLGQSQHGILLKRGKYQANLEAAQKYERLLEHIVSTYPLSDWVPAAIARQGSLYDSLRTGLYEATPPRIKMMFDPTQAALMSQIVTQGSGGPPTRQTLANQMIQAQQLRDSAKESWRVRKGAELAAADELMVRRYASATALARKYGVQNDAVSHALARLAYFTGIIGEAAMREYVTNTKDPTDPSQSGYLPYSNGMYVQSHAGP
jgi:hypothetical protein